MEDSGEAGEVLRRCLNVVSIKETARDSDGNPITNEERLQRIYDQLKLSEPRIVGLVDNKVTPQNTPAGVLPPLEEFTRISGDRNSINNNPVKVIFDDGSTFSFSGLSGIRQINPARQDPRGGILVPEPYF